MYGENFGFWVPERVAGHVRERKYMLQAFFSQIADYANLVSPV